MFMFMFMYFYLWGYGVFGGYVFGGDDCGGGLQWSAVGWSGFLGLCFSSFWVGEVEGGRKGGRVREWGSGGVGRRVYGGYLV